MMIMVVASLQILTTDMMALLSCPSSLESGVSSTAGQLHSAEILKHVVVAHCTENLAWLDQLHDFDPLICKHTRIHIYSKCGMGLDLEITVPAVAECTTLHRIRNCGSEEFAYLRYIEDRYDSMPPMISFVQGGAMTENPHIIYDMMVHVPGTTYQDLSRHVRVAWHMIDYKDNTKKKGEEEIMMHSFRYMQNQSSWLTNWRGMFAVSRDQIKQHQWHIYADINDKLCRKECNFLNCNMEVWFSTLFHCNSHLFQNSSHENETKCTSGVYTNISRIVFEEDYKKDGQHDPKPNLQTEWISCGNRTIFYAGSSINGALICTDGTITNEEMNKHLYSELVLGETWRANLTNMTWDQPPQWARHQKFADKQNNQ